MELFAAGDESQMEVIKQWIDESDIYLLIFGGRYGSIDPKSGKSYTQLEYEYALNKNKPLFACVIKDAALDARIKKYGKEAIDDYRKEWNQFRELVQSKIVEFWEDSKDIKIAIANKLGQLSRREDLVGWIRAHKEADLPALSNEIARLSKENADLRSQLGSKPEIFINGLSYSQLKVLLQEKGLWDYVRRNKQQLHGRVSRNTAPIEIDALHHLGLIKLWRDGYELFEPTEAGIMLLNRIEFEELPRSVAPTK